MRLHFLAIILLVFLTGSFNSAPNRACQVGAEQVSATSLPLEESKGCHVYGKIKFVEHHADYQVKFVDHHEDLRVKYVEHFSDDPGKWEIVDHHEDYRIEIVEYHEDFRVKEVDHFPGCE